MHVQSGNVRVGFSKSKQISVEIAQDPPSRLPPLSVCLRHFCFHYFLPSHWTFGGWVLTSYLLLCINNALVNSNADFFSIPYDEEDKKLDQICRDKKSIVKRCLFSPDYWANACQMPPPQSMSDHQAFEVASHPLKLSSTMFNGQLTRNSWFAEGEWNWLLLLHILLVRTMLWFVMMSAV